MILNRVTVRIRKHERGLMFRFGDYVRTLGPGEHRLWARLRSQSRAEVELVSMLKSRFEHSLMDAMLKDPALASELTVIDLTQSQRALIWLDGRLGALLGPGRHVYWNQPMRVEIERFDIKSLRFEHELVDQVLQLKGAQDQLEAVHVVPESAVLLYRNGALAERLGPGQHVLWKGSGKLSYRTVDLREKTADVSGQEIMTADKLTLRVNLTVVYQVVDALKSVNVTDNADQSLYREAQLALRAAVGGRTLDQLLGDKLSVGQEVSQALEARAEEFGVKLKSVGLRDIVLPGDMKAILNQVVEAERKAQAELIRRREETASVRSQANTARLLAENPMLARVRELELLKDVLSGTRATFVFGQGDLAEQVRSMVSGVGDKQ